MCPGGTWGAAAPEGGAAACLAASSCVTCTSTASRMPGELRLVAAACLTILGCAVACSRVGLPVALLTPVLSWRARITMPECEWRRAPPLPPPPAGGLGLGGWAGCTGTLGEGAAGWRAMGN